MVEEYGSENNKILVEELNLLRKRIAELQSSQNELKTTKENLQSAYHKLKETQNLLIQAEKMQTIGTLVSGIAHEIKNPLGIIVQGVDFLERKLTASEDKEIKKVILMIRDSIKRADAIICSLFDFSQLKSFQVEPENINLIIDASLTLVQQRLKFSHIEIIKEFQHDMPKVMVDKNKVEQAFINILLNAVQSIPEEKTGKILIRSYDSHSDQPHGSSEKIGDERFRAGERVAVIEIEDTGCGIPDEDFNNIFNPFFTTKRPGSGIGLGLPITKGIIEMHNGLMQIKSKEHKGTKVIIFLDIAH